MIVVMLALFDSTYANRISCTLEAWLATTDQHECRAVVKETVLDQFASELSASFLALRTDKALVGIAQC